MFIEIILWVSLKMIDEKRHFIVLLAIGDRAKLGSIGKITVMLQFVIMN